MAKTKYSPSILKAEIPEKHHRKGSLPYFVPLFGQMFWGRLLVAMNIVQKYLPSDQPNQILEIGSGFGQVTTLLGERYPNSKIVALDILYVGLPYVRQLADKYGNPHTQPLQGDAYKLPFKDQAFDALFTFDTLEHVPDAAAALDNIYQVLKPGGIAVIMVPVEAMILRAARYVYLNLHHEWHGGYHWQGKIKMVGEFRRVVHQKFTILHEQYYPLAPLGRELNYEYIVIAQRPKTDV